MFLATEAMKMKGFIVIHIFLPSLHWGITGYRSRNRILFISPFRFVPYQWGSFFNKFHPFRFEYPSCEGIKYAYFSPLSTRVSLLKGYRECISYICYDFANLETMRWIPLIQSFHVYARANGCSLSILKLNDIFIAFKKCNKQ